MREWNDLSEKTPVQGEVVEIRVPGGRDIKPVQFYNGRFWKVRKEGHGGQAYTVEYWRSIESKSEAKGKEAADENS